MCDALQKYPYQLNFSTFCHEITNFNSLMAFNLMEVDHYEGSIKLYIIWCNSKNQECDENFQTQQEKLLSPQLQFRKHSSERYQEAWTFKSQILTLI